MKQSDEKPRERERWPWLLGGVRPITRAGALSDALAGTTLVAMNVPQALGYARIAGMPVVTGLYALLLPMATFAALGSSRYLVVAADSATAAILAGGLSQIAPIASEHYAALAGVVALLTAGCLLLARLFELGFLADFLAQTLLVGFLTGVGLQVAIAMLGEMVGVSVTSGRTVDQLMQIVHGLPHLHVPTLCITGAALTIIFVCNRFAPRWPGPLLAVVGAIAASSAFDFSGHGIAVIRRVAGGLPPIGLPRVGWREVPQLLPVTASCFLMIVAQSAATARAYAFRHRQPHDENADLVGLSAANAAAALSGTFVVNGSPTQTAMVERSGGQSQFAQLVTAAIVAFVLLFLTAPLRFLPRCVLSAIVFTIAIGLIDLRGLSDIRRESPGEFCLSLITAAIVVGVGVEQGVLVAIALSLLWHVRHSYRPYTAVLVERSGQWRTTPAVPGAVSRPGLVIFQFGADLFYANAGRFVANVRSLVEGAEPPIKWLVVDAGAITSIDFSAARVLADLQRDLVRRNISLVLVHAEPSLRADLHRHRLSGVLGADHIFDTLREALAAIEDRRISVVTSTGHG